MSSTITIQEAFNRLNRVIIKNIATIEQLTKRVAWLTEDNVDKSTLIAQLSERVSEMGKDILGIRGAIGLINMETRELRNDIEQIDIIQVGSLDPVLEPEDDEEDEEEGEDDEDEEEGEFVDAVPKNTTTSPNDEHIKIGLFVKIPQYVGGLTTPIDRFTSSEDPSDNDGFCETKHVYQPADDDLSNIVPPDAVEENVTSDE